MTTLNPQLKTRYELILPAKKYSIECMSSKITFEISVHSHQPGPCDEYGSDFLPLQDTIIVYIIGHRQAHYIKLQEGR
jgi:hypothetical protein